MNQQLELEQLCTISSLDTLSPKELATLLDFLIQHERVAGGPYLFDVNLKKNVYLNYCVYLLFARAGKKLTGTFSYIVASRDLLPRKKRLAVAAIIDSQKPAQDLNYTSADHTSSRQKSIYASVNKKLSTVLSPELLEHVTPLLAKLKKLDNDGEITQLAQLAVQALPVYIESTATTRTAQLLGKANLYTWLAYSLYDAVIDQEATPFDLSAANVIQRLAVNTYQLAGLPFEKIHKALDGVDTANALEVAYCRATVEGDTITLAIIPRTTLLKRLLSDRSFVHCLGALTLTHQYRPPHSDHQLFKRSLKKYCAVRQLNDDIHDWEDDLEHGRITYVVAHLLKVADIQPGSYPIPYLTTLLRQVFWESQLDFLLDKALEIATQVRQEYVTSLGFAPRSTFDAVTIEPIIKSIEKAKNQLDFDKEFLKVAVF